jgi:AcrR family transcriptional regulator
MAKSQRHSPRATTTGDVSSPIRPGGRPAKRRAILDGALGVFAQDGYTRASIDAISAAAGVSTRTIYNHFKDKAQLFQTVVEESTTGVAGFQITVIDRHLGKITDLESDLVQLGLALAAPMTAYEEHFALIRQIDADAGHIPPAALDAWRDAGPRRVLGVLAGRLQELADRDLLRIDDPHRAAVHLMLLVQGAVPFHHGMATTSEDDVAEIVTAGVHAFLHGYLP